MRSDEPVRPAVEFGASGLRQLKRKDGEVELRHKELPKFNQAVGGLGPIS